MKRQKRSKTGQLGVNVVERVVIDELLWRWQPLDQHNDDGLDGLILVEDGNGELTGQTIFAQVKCWKKTQPKTGTVQLNVKAEKLAKRAMRWRRVAGASIVIWVDPTTKDAFWGDLQSPSTVTDKGIRIPLKNRFNVKSANQLRRLAGTQGQDNLLPVLQATHLDTAHIQPAKSLKDGSKAFYQAIGTASSPDPRLGQVQFSRVGWKHITRKGRPISRVVQSLHLLPLAKRIVEEVPKAQLLRRIGGASNPAEVFAVSARVIFQHRDAAVVRVIVLRQLPGSANPAPRTWFYSVYERRRRRGLRGEHR